MGVGDIEDSAGLALGAPAQLNAQGWQNRSEDIFVPGPHGFFKVIGRDPESVVANFAVGKGIHKNKDQTEKVKSKALASTRVNQRLELCAIEVEPGLSSDACQMDRAFVAIDGYLQGLHGRLDLQHVTWTAVGNTGRLKSSKHAGWRHRHMVSGGWRDEVPEPAGA